MITKIYRVKGTFVMGEENSIFIKEYKATNEAEIEEKIYERFGSKHGLNRNQISIDEITEIAPEDVTDPILKEIL
ncbi:MAG: 50S ribosomal protein L18a [Methanobrevibacter sp.]|nr:50S ribosomal protein L18a [Methanobrevibacter sp.]